MSPSQIDADDQGDEPAPSHGEEHVVDEEEHEHDPVGVRSEDDVAQRVQARALAGPAGVREAGHSPLVHHGQPVARRGCVDLASEPPALWIGSDDSRAVGETFLG